MLRFEWCCTHWELLRKHSLSLPLVISVRHLIVILLSRRTWRSGWTMNYSVLKGDSMQRGNVRGGGPVSGVNWGLPPPHTVPLECEGKGIRGGSEAEARRDYTGLWLWAKKCTYCIESMGGCECALVIRSFTRQCMNVQYVTDTGSKRKHRFYITFTDIHVLVKI